MGLWTQISGFQSQLHHQLALWTQARSEPAVPQFPLCDMVWRVDLGKVCGERTGPGIKGETQGPIMRQTWGASDTLLNPRPGTTRTCAHTHALFQARLAPWSCLRCGCQGRASPPLCFCLALPPPREQVAKELQVGKQPLHEDRAPGCGPPLAGSAPGSGSMAVSWDAEGQGWPHRKPRGHHHCPVVFCEGPCGSLRMTSQQAFVQKEKQNPGGLIRLRYAHTQVGIF